MDQFTQQRLQEIEEKGHFELDIAELWKNGFEIWKKVTIPTLLGGLITIVPAMVIIILCLPFIFGMNVQDFIQMAQRSPIFFQQVMSSFEFQTKIIGISFIIGLLFAPMTPGYIKLCHEADSNNEVRFSTLFKYYHPDYLFKIIGFTLITLICVSIPGVLLQSLGILGQLANYGLILVYGIFTVFVFPLIIFSKASLIDAIKTSISLALKGFIYVLAFYILGNIFSAVGLILCCVGVLFSFCYVYIAAYLVYKQVIGFEKDDDVTATEGYEY